MCAHMHNAYTRYSYVRHTLSFDNTFELESIPKRCISFVIFTQTNMCVRKEKTNIDTVCHSYIDMRNKVPRCHLFRHNHYQYMCTTILIHLSSLPLLIHRCFGMFGWLHEYCVGSNRRVCKWAAEK